MIHVAMLLEVTVEYVHLGKNNTDVCYRMFLLINA